MIWEPADELWRLGSAIGQYRWTTLSEACTLCSLRQYR